MSIHTDALRDIGDNHGWPVCSEAADEIEMLEKEVQEVKDELVKYINMYGSHLLSSSAVRGLPR